jgi:hypothetical protein
LVTVVLMFDENAPRMIKKQKRLFKPVYLVVGIIVLLTATVAVLVVKIYGTPPVKVPDAITQKAASALYIPRNLPTGFRVSADSFTYDEETVIFEAEDTTGASIVFTERKRPKDFDFENFYKGQIENAVTLRNTPYPSVIGKAPTGGRQLLSIVTDETWIMASTVSPLSQDDFVLIANGIKKY